MAGFTIRTMFSANEAVTAALDRMSAGAARFAGTAEKSMRRASSAASMFGSVTSSILAAAGITSVLDLIKSGITGIVTETASLEMATTNFKVLTGSMENATKVVNDLRKFAAVSPFSFKDLEPVTKMLMGFGVVTKDTVIPTLNMLGDVSMGNAEKLSGMTLAFSQIMSGGRAYQQDINQLINAGVPIMKALGQQWGVPIAKVRELIKAGKATSSEIMKAFQRMTGPGGMFFKGMEEGSRTLIGTWATFQDQLSMIATAIGTAMLPQIKELVASSIRVAETVLKWVEANKTLIALKFQQSITAVTTAARDLWPTLQFIAQAIVFMWPVIKELVPLLVAMGAAWTFNAIAMRGVALLEMVSGFLALVKGIRSVAAAQLALNIAMTANPIGVIIVAVGALIALIIYLEIRFKVFSNLWDNWAAGMKVLGMPGFGDEGAGGGAAPQAPIQAPIQQIMAQTSGVNFNGQLNIAGAPAGSTVTSKTSGAPPIRVAMLGAQ